jgi:hypothetical protein
MEAFDIYACFIHAFEYIYVFVYTCLEMCVCVHVFRHFCVFLGLHVYFCVHVYVHIWNLCVHTCHLGTPVSHVFVIFVTRLFANVGVFVCTCVRTHGCVCFLSVDVCFHTYL